MKNINSSEAPNVPNIKRIAAIVLGYIMSRPRYAKLFKRYVGDDSGVISNVRDHIRILLYMECTTRYSFPRTSQYMVVQEARVSRGGPRTTHSFNYKQTDYSRRKCRMFTAGFGMKETN
jgi:hypothetical protein